MVSRKKHRLQKKKTKKFNGFQDDYGSTFRQKKQEKKYSSELSWGFRLKKIITNVFGHRGIVVDLGLAFYILFFNGVLYGVLYRRVFRESLLESTSGVIYHSQTNYLLGTLLLLATIGEFIAILLKRKEIGESEKKTGSLFIIWMFHTVISTVLVIIALKAFGLSMTKNQGLFAGIFMVVVLKELVILFLIFIGSQPQPLPGRKRIIADLLMLFFYCVAYTVTWETIMGQPNFNNHLLAANYSPILTVTYTLIAILLFCVFYLPLRLPYFMTEKKYTPREKWIDTAIILLAAFMAICPLFKGYAPL